MTGRYTLGTGPRGGLEYRKWTGESTYVLVNRYEAWPHLCQQARDVADEHTAARKAARKAEAESAAVWRSLRAGR